MFAKFIVVILSIMMLITQVSSVKVAPEAHGTLHN